MLSKLKEMFGVYLYCVEFTFLDRNKKYVGMLSIICTARCSGEAEYKAVKKLHKAGITFTGDWIINAEQI